MKDIRPAFARPASDCKGRNVRQAGDLPVPYGGQISPEQDGMTYREWAAAHVLAALVVGEGDWDGKFIAKIAVDLTDVLIAELDKEDRNV